MPSPFVQIAIVNAHAMKMINAWTKWMMFLLRPRFPPDGRGSRICILVVGAEDDRKGGFQPFRISPNKGRKARRVSLQIDKKWPERKENEPGTRRATVKNAQKCERRSRRSGNGPRGNLRVTRSWFLGFRCQPRVKSRCGPTNVQYMYKLFGRR